MKQLHLSDDLSFPLSIATQRTAFVGTAGGGKTYGAMRMAELMIEASAGSGHFTNTLGRLRTLMVCDYPAAGEVELAKWIRDVK